MRVRDEVLDCALFACPISWLAKEKGASWEGSGWCGRRKLRLNLPVARYPRKDDVVLWWWDNTAERTELQRLCLLSLFRVV